MKLKLTCTDCEDLLVGKNDTGDIDLMIGYLEALKRSERFKKALEKEPEVTQF